MSNPLSTSDAPKLLEKSARKVYIKDGQRKMLTDTGYMKTPASLAKRHYGTLQGGKYSTLQ